MSSVKRSYKVGLRFDGDNPREIEKQANQIVKRYQQIVLDKIVDQNMVDHAYELLDDNPALSGTYGARHLAKKVADGSNIGQVSTTYTLSAVNGAIDRESKIGHLLDLFQQYPEQAVSWMVFKRTPFLEKSLAYRLDVNFEYARNLVHSAARNMTTSFAEVLLPSLSRQDFKTALLSKLDDISAVIIKRKSEGKNIASTRRFYSKLEFLKKHSEFLAFCLYHWLQNHIAYNTGSKTDFGSAWHSLKRLSYNFTDMLGLASCKFNHLFSAIRSVVVHALSDILSGTVKNLCETVKERDLVSKPFRKERTELLPVNLIMGSKYVITRPGNAQVMTDLALKHQRFSLGIKDPDKRGRTIEAQVLIHDRLHRMLKKGAQITSLAIRSGKPPSHKIIVIINMEGKRSAFETTGFLKQYDDLELDETTKIGLDINRVGRNLVVFSEEIELPDTLRTITERYLALEDEIAKLSTVVSKTGSVKHKAELDRVYRRRKRLLHEIKIQCKLLTTAVLVQAGASELYVEDLNVSARGTSGALAKAILNMPDELNIFEQAVFLASSETDTEVELKTVNPWKTSSIHYRCGGKIKRDLRSWDIARCIECDREIDTHLNAARNIRAGGIINPAYVN